MTATPHSSPDPLAALPLLTEAGVSVYWQPLDGRTAWVADAESRQVWLSRSIPRDAILRCLIQALEALDEGDGAAPAETPPPRPRLVHSAETVEDGSRPEPPALRAVDQE